MCQSTDRLLYFCVKQTNKQTKESVINSVSLNRSLNVMVKKNRFMRLHSRYQAHSFCLLLQPRTKTNQIFNKEGISEWNSNVSINSYFFRVDSKRVQLIVVISHRRTSFFNTCDPPVSDDSDEHSVIESSQ